VWGEEKKKEREKMAGISFSGPRFKPGTSPI
jgi:hypothetical protein